MMKNMDDLMDTIDTYLDDEKREQVRNELSENYFESDVEIRLERLIGKELNFFELDVIKAVSDLILNDFEELTEVLSEYYLKSLLVTLIMQSSRLLKKKHMNEETEISYNKYPAYGDIHRGK